MGSYSLYYLHLITIPYLTHNVCKPIVNDSVILLGSLLEKALFC